MQKKKSENNQEIEIIKKKITNSLTESENLKIDVIETELKKSDIVHLLNMSKASENEKKVNDKWNMDSHKLFWHLDRVEAWQRGEKFPLHIDMGISRDVILLYFVMELFKIEMVLELIRKIFHTPVESVKQIFKDAKEIGVKSALIGEGKIHCIKLSRNNFYSEIDLDLSLATNGIRIDHKKLDIILESLKWIRFNISAGTKETFQKIHRVNQMDRVLGNARALAKRKKEINSSCVIGFQMVVTKENMNDIVPLSKLGRECGVDYFVVKPCSDTFDSRLDSPKGEYIEALEIFKEAEQYSTKDYSVNVKWKKVLNGGWKDYTACHGTQFILGLSGRGDVFHVVIGLMKEEMNF